MSGSRAAVKAMTVRDFSIAVPDEQLDDLRRRSEATRWPRPPYGAGWNLGTDIVWLQSLCE
jgi:hypothetical protein